MRMPGFSRSDHPLARSRSSGLGRLHSFTGRHPNGRNRAQTRCQRQPVRTAGSGGKRSFPIWVPIEALRHKRPFARSDDRRVRGLGLFSLCDFGKKVCHSTYARSRTVDTIQTYENGEIQHGRPQVSSPPRD